MIRCKNKVCNKSLRLKKLMVHKKGGVPINMWFFIAVTFYAKAVITAQTFRILTMHVSNIGQQVL